MLIKRSGARLGFTAVPATISTPDNVYGSSGVFVQTLQRGGVVEAHNRFCRPGEAIRPGDCIVRAGSAVLDAHGIMRALTEAGHILVSVLKMVKLQEASVDSELQCPVVRVENMPSDLEGYLVSVEQAPAVPAVRAPAKYASDLPGLSEAAPAVRAEAKAKYASEPAGGSLEARRREPADAAKGRGKKAQAPVAAKTTLMLQHVPCEFTRDMLAELLDQKGFSGLYDFIYMRMNLRMKTPYTYAFVNLVTPQAAEACCRVFAGFLEWGIPGAGPCKTSWANTEQGLEMNIERYRNSPIMHEDMPDAWKPAVYRDGARVAFPPPTQLLKTPPMRKSEGGAWDAQSSSEGGWPDAGQPEMGKTLTDRSQRLSVGSLGSSQSAASLRETRHAGGAPWASSRLQPTGEAEYPIILRMSF